MKELTSYHSFGGVQKQFEHDSTVLNCSMRFSLYLPLQVANGKMEGDFTKDDPKVPVLYWLSGLTCTDENFVQKAGAQRMAAELGIAIVAPDTSPRGESVANDEAYDLGQGAGFYVNATQAPWDKHFQMYDYILDELPKLIEAHFPVTDKRSISGHSMGGHGALVIGLRNRGRYQSISAFSPISNPVNCPWGQKAFSAYLGEDKANWLAYDAVENLKGLSDSEHPPILIEQGLGDSFLEEQLKPNSLVDASKEIILNQHEGYDHSYFFIASFIDEHLRFHAGYLK